MIQPPVQDLFWQMKTCQEVALPMLQWVCLDSFPGATIGSLEAGSEIYYQFLNILLFVKEIL